MKALVIGDSHTDIYKMIRFLCSTTIVHILRIPGMTAQGLIKMEDSTLQGGYTALKFILDNLDADLIIFFVGSVDLDYVYYAKSAQKHSPSSSIPISPPLLPSTSSSPSPSSPLDEILPFDTLLDGLETNTTDINTKEENFPPSKNTDTNITNNANPNIATTKNNNTTNTESTENSTNTANTTNTSNTSTTGSKVEENTVYPITEEVEYAANRFLQYLDKHIIPIVPPTAKLVLNSLHPPTLSDSNNEGRLKHPDLMGNLYHSLVGLTFPTLPTHKERTEACQTYNKLLQIGAENRGLHFLDVCSPMLNPNTGVILPYMVRSAPFDVHIVEEMAIPTYLTELQKIDERWIVDKWKRNQVQKIIQKIQNLKVA